MYLLQCSHLDEYFDAETGTIYLRARYYSPTTGRFVQRDRFAGRKTDPLSLNRYTYCRNNPIIFIDPSGYSYGTLPDGTKFSINSNSDAQKFQAERNKQLSEQQPPFDVYLAVHKVTGDNYHTSIVIYENKKIEQEYTDLSSQFYMNRYDNLFKNTDERGVRYVTLGAGTNGLFEFLPKDLVSKSNRKKDAMLDIKVQMINLNVIDTYTVYKLIACQQHYQETYNDPIFSSAKVNYDLFPGESTFGYNSNSFTHGLLNAVGIEAPEPQYNVPGWNKPLPNSYFGTFNDFYSGLHQDKVRKIDELLRR